MYSQSLYRHLLCISGAVKSTAESLFREFHKQIMPYWPTYIVTNIPVMAQFTMSEVNNICGDNKLCQYDYLVTGDSKVAKASLNAMNWHRTMKEFLQPGRYIRFMVTFPSFFHVLFFDKALSPSKTRFNRPVVNKCDC